MKGRGVTKSVKAIKFEGVWHELELKKCFQGQWLRKCSGGTLVFIWSSSQWGV